MGWRGNVIFRDIFTMQELVGEHYQASLLDEIKEWADAHGGQCAWETVVDSTYHVPTDRYGVMIQDAKIPQKELSGVDEFLKIAGKDAYFGTVSFYPEEHESAPKEKKPVSVIDIIKQAIQLLPPAERQNLMNMKLGDILCDTKSTKFNKSKFFVLTNGHKLDCPVCGSHGCTRIIDGELICGCCNHSWGDIDKLPDII